MDDQDLARRIAEVCYGQTPHLALASAMHHAVFRLRFPTGTKILKLSKPGKAAGMRKELSLIDLLGGLGLPVPSVEHRDPDGRLVGRPFFIMASAGEETVADSLRSPGETTDRLFHEMGVVLARIHQVVLARPEEQAALGLERRNPREQVNRLYETAEWLAERGWLRRAEASRFETLALPELGGRELCHSDFHTVQCVVRDGRIVAVVDWESAWVGNAFVDLAIAHGYLDLYAGPDLSSRFFQGYTSIRPLAHDYAERYLPIRMALPLSLLRVWREQGPRSWRYALDRGKVQAALSLYRRYLAALDAPRPPLS